MKLDTKFFFFLSNHTNNLLKIQIIEPIFGCNDLSYKISNDFFHKIKQG